MGVVCGDGGIVRVVSGGRTGRLRGEGADVGTPATMGTTSGVEAGEVGLVATGEGETVFLGIVWIGVGSNVGVISGEGVLVVGASSMGVGVAVIVGEAVVVAETSGVTVGIGTGVGVALSVELAADVVATGVGLGGVTPAGVPSPSSLK